MLKPSIILFVIFIASLSNVNANVFGACRFGMGTFGIGEDCGVVEPPPEPDDTSTASSGASGTEPQDDFADGINKTEPIIIQLPDEWEAGKETEVKLYFFKEKLFYDPNSITFDFKPFDYFIYKNLTNQSNKQ